MPGSVAFQNQREFRCSHCSGKILVPKDLPPMTGPCPHCGTTITSPGPEDDKPPVQQVSAKVEVPAVVVKEKVEVPVPAPEPVKPPVGPPPLPPSAAKPAPLPEPEPIVAKAPEEPVPLTSSDISPPAISDRGVAATPPAPVATVQPPAPAPEVGPIPEPTATVAKEIPKPEPLVRAEVPEVKVESPSPETEPEPKLVEPAPEPRMVVPISEESQLSPTKEEVLPAAAEEESSAPAPRPRAVVPIGLQGSPSFADEAPAIPSSESEKPREGSVPPTPQKVVIPIGLNPVPPPPSQEKSAEPAVAPQRVVVPIGLNPVLPPAEEKSPVIATRAVESDPPVVVPEVQRPVSHSAPSSESVVPVTQAASTVSPVREEPPPIAVPPIETAQPIPVKISIGLTEEALASVRPAPEPVPEVLQQPIAATPSPTVPAPDYTAAPDVLRERESKTKTKVPSDKPRKGILVPMLLLLLLVLGGGGAALFFLTKPMGKGAQAVPVNPAIQAKIRESQYSQSGWQEEARQVLGSFLAADGAAGKAAFSIRGSELLPQMNNFYGNGKIDDSDTPLSGFAIKNLTPEDHKRGIFRMVYDQPPQFEMREFFRPLAPIEVQFGLKEPDLLLSSLARASNFSSEPVKVEMFFKREADGLKVDWETFAQTKYRTFRSLTELADPGRTAIFRLFIVEDVPERGRASQGTKTYRLADPAHSKTDWVRVEVPVDSELGRSFSILNWRGVPDAKPITKTVTLELAWTRDASPRLIVSRFICWEFLGIGGQAVGGTAPAGQ